MPEADGRGEEEEGDQLMGRGGPGWDPIDHRDHPERELERDPFFLREV